MQFSALTNVVMMVVRFARSLKGALSVPLSEDIRFDGVVTAYTSFALEPESNAASADHTRFSFRA